MVLAFHKQMGSKNQTRNHLISRPLQVMLRSQVLVTHQLANSTLVHLTDGGTMVDRQCCAVVCAIVSEYSEILGEQSMRKQCMCTGFYFLPTQEPGNVRSYV